MFIVTALFLCLEHVQVSPIQAGIPDCRQACASLVLDGTEDEHGTGLQPGFAGPGD